MRCSAARLFPLLCSVHLSRQYTWVCSILFGWLPGVPDSGCAVVSLTQVPYWWTGGHFQSSRIEMPLDLHLCAPVLLLLQGEFLEVEFLGVHIEHFNKIVSYYLTSCILVLEGTLNEVSAVSVESLKDF